MVLTATMMDLHHNIGSAVRLGCVGCTGRHAFARGAEGWYSHNERRLVKSASSSNTMSCMSHDIRIFDRIQGRDGSGCHLGTWVGTDKANRKAGGIALPRNARAGLSEIIISINV